MALSTILKEGSVWLAWLRDRFLPKEAATPGEDSFRRRWGAITVCGLIAVVLWFTLSIRETYTIQVEMPTQVVNLPDDQALTVLPPATVQVQVSGEGFDLFGLRFNPPTLLIDGQADDVTLQDLVVLPQGLSSEGVLPRTFVVQKETRISRKIPIRLRAVVAPAEAHDFFAEPFLTPDSIVVSGAASIINTLKAWPTEVFRRTGVQDSLVMALSLVDTLDGLVEKSHAQTILTAVAPEYTEDSRVLRVGVAGVPTTQLVVQLEPPSVRVTYRVPLSQFEQAHDAEDFLATVSYNVIRADTTGRVRPRINFPAGVSLLNVDISPSTLRYYERLVEQ